MKTVSHWEFIDSVNFVVNQCFKTKPFWNLTSCIPQNHGRIPSALNKRSVNWKTGRNKILREDDVRNRSTSIADTIHGNELSLTIGGVRALNHESLFSKKSIEKFKVFIGFQNKVCTNLLVSTDGILLNFVFRITRPYKNVFDLVGNYQYEDAVGHDEEFGKYALTEHQFAQMIGKARLYPILPAAQRRKFLH